MRIWNFYIILFINTLYKWIINYKHVYTCFTPINFFLVFFNTWRGTCDMIFEIPRIKVGCWNNIWSWFCFVIISTYFHLLGYVTKHIILEHMNKLMNIPFGRLNILRKPQKCHIIWNVYCCAMEPMVVSNPFPYCTYIYELCTFLVL